MGELRFVGPDDITRDIASVHAGACAEVTGMDVDIGGASKRSHPNAHQRNASMPFDELLAPGGLDKARHNIRRNTPPTTASTAGR